MTKRVFLRASGDDHSAMNFDRNFDIQKFYEDMVKEGVTKKTIDTDEFYIDVKILEFGEIDDKFISFVRDFIMDYDMSKANDFFEVTPI
jgi:hypothetical protein